MIFADICIRYLGMTRIYREVNRQSICGQVRSRAVQLLLFNPIRQCDVNLYSATCFAAHFTTHLIQASVKNNTKIAENY